MIRGGLITKDFLIEGIVETEAWRSLTDDDVARTSAKLNELLDDLLKLRHPTEADTEKRFIWPVLEALGWTEVLIQQNLTVKGRRDVPDALLFGDRFAYDLAAPLEPYQRFKHGLCVVEAKRWQRPLDRESKGAKNDDGVPSTQMLRYLRRVEDLAPGGLRWGILTNGNVWRLYWQGAVSVAEDFFEIDLAKVLRRADLDLFDRQNVGIDDPETARAHALRLFILFFGRDAFRPIHVGRTFHDDALEQGKFWERRVAGNLSDTVFDRVFPTLANAIAQADPLRDAAFPPAYLETLRQGTLVLLYRLLFVLYAEDRNLLPDENGPYADYALTKQRIVIAERLTAGKVYPASSRDIWSRLTGIFRAIAKGDDDLGIPPYNGGLFSGDTAPILDRVTLPDPVMAEVIFRLSHQEDGKSPRGPKYINYRDLSVQQLGSVYERILEHDLRAGSDGTVEVVVDPSARKGFGSYYTPEELVTLVIRRTVGPLVRDRRDAFAAAVEDGIGDGGAKAERLERLRLLDPACRLLDLRICDPAMGSGHFLVTLVDWLADEVLAAMAEASTLVDWADYASPLAARIEAIRADIQANATERGWPVRDDQLDDRHLVRRMILKRVVHGVDKNRMAVELAKVSLWLHSFTVGAPLSFLDHHLRWGDSVVGGWAGPVRRQLADHGALLGAGLIGRVEAAAAGMRRVEESNDNDLSEVARSEAAFSEVEEDTAGIGALFSLLTAERMMGVFDAQPRKMGKSVEDLVRNKASERVIAKARADAAAFARAVALEKVVSGAYGDPTAVAAGATPVEGGDVHRSLAEELVAEASALAERHRFLHWQLAFPNIWSDLTSNRPRGGFDAVIGNPPYVRQELLGEIKPALKPRADDGGLKRPRDGDHPDVWANWRGGLLDVRPGFLAFDGVADLYVYFYEQGLRLLRPGGRMGYVVTNKWLKAGYAEALRGLFEDAAWVEFVADFGHAKHFFPDADVFPSILVVRRPDDAEAPSEMEVCAIPRDAVPEKGVEAVVEIASHPMPRALFTRREWTLEPPAVMALLDKIRRNGVPLAEYAGAKPLYGIKTGFNEAFLIDTPTRDRLVAEDPGCAEIIKPYLRGQDVERWYSPPSGLFMIVMKSSGDHPWPWAGAADQEEAETMFRATHPSLHRHFKPFEAQLRKRSDKGRFWWELRSCAYYEKFRGRKIVYPDISWAPKFFLLREDEFTNDLLFMIPTNSDWMLSVLNSPVSWYFLWRHTIHGKDEVLRLKSLYMESVPIPSDINFDPANIDVLVESAGRLFCCRDSIENWLHHEFGLERLPRVLATPHTLDADGFVEAVRAALPKRRRLTALDIGELKREHGATIVPARNAAAEILRLERRLSDLVNAAYGLTPEEVRLMWETAPPRMPLDPAEELARMTRDD